MTGLSWTLFMHPGTALIELHVSVVAFLLLLERNELTNPLLQKVSDLNGAAQCFTSYAKLAGVHHK